MSDLRNHILRHSYPHDLDRLQQEFGPQFDDVSCGPSTVHHGLLLGGLTVPKTALQAYFRTTPDPGPDEFDYLDEERIAAGLDGLGFCVEERYRKSGETTPQFLEWLGQELDTARVAFAMACIYWSKEAGWGESHWIMLGRWRDGRIRAADSAWYPTMYSLTPKAFDNCGWGNKKDGYGVLLVRPRDWRKNYEEWLPGRDRLLRLEGHPLEASATMAQRLQSVARVIDDGEYHYDQVEFCLSEKSGVAIRVVDKPKEAVGVSTPTGDERYGQVGVVRRLVHGEPGQSGPPELIFRMSELSGWQLG